MLGYWRAQCFLRRALRAECRTSSAVPWVKAVADLEFPVLHLVVGDEEVLDFADQVFAEVVDVFDLFVFFGFGADGDEAVVAFGFSVFGLVGFDDADEADRDDEAGGDGGLAEDENVEGVAVGAEGSGDVAEVEREGGAGREDGVECEGVEGFVEFEFGAGRNLRGFRSWRGVRGFRGGRGGVRRGGWGAVCGVFWAWGYLREGRSARGAPGGWTGRGKWLRKKASAVSERVSIWCAYVMIA